MKTGTRTAAVAAAIVLGLSGCGEDDGGPGGDAAQGEDRSFYERVTSTELQNMTADEIEAATLDATLELGSLRVRGTVPVDGTTAEMDVTLSTGEGCHGTMRQETGGFDFVGLSDGSSFMRTDADFLRALPDEDLPEQAVDLMADRWIDVGPADNSFKEFCDLDGLFDELRDDSQGGLTVGEPRPFEGREVLPLVGEEDGETTTVLVANDDEHPYLVHVRSDGPEGEFSVTLSEFDKPVDVRAPKDAVTFEDLQEEAAGGPPATV